VPLAAGRRPGKSLYRLYADHDLPPEWGHQRLEARIATEEQAALLEITAGDALLCVRRITYTLENVPIEWMQSFSPGGLFAVEMTLRR
jgi:DNA-binding GntR family transcriptional regulator